MRATYALAQNLRAARMLRGLGHDPGDQAAEGRVARALAEDPSTAMRSSPSRIGWTARARRGSGRRGRERPDLLGFSGGCQDQHAHAAKIEHSRRETGLFKIGRMAVLNLRYIPTASHVDLQPK